jgi:heme o synthase
VLTKIKTYYQLTKPGIIYGNILNTTAGFLLASSIANELDAYKGFLTLLGIALVIGSGCVFNNYIDRDIDKKMARTKKRALARGEVSAFAALLYATLLGAAGFAILAFFANALTVWLGVLAIGMYVVVYGLAKRRSAFGTIVGSIPGALPPVAGYTAVANQLDAGAYVIFLIFSFWQMPHFYAIAMYRQKDYEAAGIPVWPIKKGLRSTKIQILLFIMAFALANIFLTALGYTGYSYIVIMSVISLIWLWRGLRSFRTADEVKWARGMFFFSLVVVLVLTAAMSLGALLP